MSSKLKSKFIGTALSVLAACAPVKNVGMNMEQGFNRGSKLEGLKEVLFGNRCADAEDAKKSTLMIVSFRKNDAGAYSQSSCNAVNLGSGYILTAGHCVKQNDLGGMVQVFSSFPSRENEYAYAVALSERYDLALVYSSKRVLGDPTLSLVEGGLRLNDLLVYFPLVEKGVAKILASHFRSSIKLGSDERLVVSGSAIAFGDIPRAWISDRDYFGSREDVNNLYGARLVVMAGFSGAPIFVNREECYSLAGTAVLSKPVIALKSYNNTSGELVESRNIGEYAFLSSRGNIQKFLAEYISRSEQ